MVKNPDVIVIGAGLSGIAAGYHLQARCPALSYAILEGRDAIGGTWDLFRYPGVRSDSDMYTLGYTFAPWPSDQALADGPSILAYVREAARTHGIDRHIRFGHRVTRAVWSTDAARWSLEVDGPDGARTLSCRFLMVCAGYYRYDRGHAPAFPGRDQFAGAVVHPQAWPDDLDVAGQRIVVIGSGATAVTLVPALAARGAQVVMLQRSPSYVVSRPAVDPIAAWLRRRASAATAHAATRWKNVLAGRAFYEFCRRFPDRARRLIAAGVRKEVGAVVDVDTHFAPSYAPWDQRLCLVPDGDLFAAIRAGQAEVVTDHVARFTPTGVELRSGRHLAADVIVTATGLELQFLGGMTVAVDGVEVDPATTWNYKGTMLSGVPNLAMAVGYTNASWTLKAELACQFACRVLRHMDAHGYRQCTPVQDDPALPARPLLDLASGYVERARALMPRQGDRAPWRLYQNYPRDLWQLRHGAIADGVLRFTR